MLDFWVSYADIYILEALLDASLSMQLHQVERVDISENFHRKPAVEDCESASGDEPSSRSPLQAMAEHDMWSFDWSC